MAINANHPFEELEGVKCAVVEKNCTPSRAEFLKKLLEHNGYTVVLAKTPPPKAAPPKPAPPPAAGADAAPAPPPAPAETPPPPPETFTVGVTDVMFNATNAIFGRLLRTTDGKIVTLFYWKQEDEISRDEIPYYDSQQDREMLS